jgi:hypothetical protein
MTPVASTAFNVFKTLGRLKLTVHGFDAVEAVSTPVWVPPILETYQDLLQEFGAWSVVKE